jgi:hypothetical protein
MDRCPNCGATVRVGAKFCTTCGMRLPEPAATPSTNEESSRSPFDSTSTVASRWPSRSVYGGTESTTTETAGEAPAAPSDESSVASAEVDTESAVSAEPVEPVSTWGAWTAPTPATPATEDVTETASAEAEAPVSWGASEPASEEPAAEQGLAAEASTEANEVVEEVPASWTRTGETDFLQLPEQPDPAAWKSIENQLAGSADNDETSESDAADELVAEEITVDELAQEEPTAAPATPSPSIERAYTLLDELRTILDETTSPADVAVAAEAVAVESKSLEEARPSDEAVARFAELRAVVDAARENPRDFETVFGLTSRLDVIIELHDAHEKLYQAAFGDSAEKEDDESDEV